MFAAYLDCFAGVAGDMFVAALLDAGLPFEELRGVLKKLPVEGYELDCRPVRRSSLHALRFEVRLTRHEHVHRGLADIEAILREGDLPGRVLADALSVFRRLAESEARAHAVTVEKVHFHEVGAVDCILDIVASCWGLRRLGIEAVFASPVQMGQGVVECAHGQMPVPPPGALGALLGQEIVLGDGEGELTTPTGAALVAALGRAVRGPFAIRPRVIGHGAGARDTPGRPNLLRVILGDVEQEQEQEQALQIETNLDQVTPELLGYALEALLAAGAHDAWVTPAQMKKGRSGWVLSVLAPPELCLRIEEILFRETRTLGVRRRVVQRSKLARRVHAVTTPGGVVRVKERRLPDGTLRFQPEYEDVRRVARSSGRAFWDVHMEAQRAAEPDSGDQNTSE